MSNRAAFMEITNEATVRPKTRATYGRRRGTTAKTNLFVVHDTSLKQELSNLSLRESATVTAVSHDENSQAEPFLPQHASQLASRMASLSPRKPGGTATRLPLQLPDTAKHISSERKSPTLIVDRGSNTAQSDHETTATENLKHGRQDLVRNRRPQRIRSAQTPQTLSFDLSDLSNALPSTARKSVRRPKLRGEPAATLIRDDDLAALQPLLSFSGLARPVLFDKYGASIDKFYDVTKIGEGAYSSVFELKRKSDVCLEKCPNECTILKVMPLLLATQYTHNATLPEEEKLEGLTSPEDVLKELNTMRTLDPLPGFLRYRGVALTTGAWPASFVKSFRKYRQKCPSKACNADPEEIYQADQCYAIVEMGHAGVELDEVKRPNDFLIYDVFWQTALHLARAEEVVEFEHRDMHISNICVKSTGARTDVDASFVKNMQETPKYFLGLTGTQISIIDYTYSRVRITDSNGTFVNYRDCEMHKWAKTDEIAKSKSEEILQFSTYSRQAAVAAIPTGMPANSSTTPDWRQYLPQTNITWLSYLLQILLSRAGKIKRTRYVESSSDAAVQVQDRLRRTMNEVRDLLMISSEKQAKEEVELPRDTTGLIELAIRRGWLASDEISQWHERLSVEDE